METVMTMIPRCIRELLKDVTEKTTTVMGLVIQRTPRDVLDITEIKTVMDLVPLGGPNAFVPQLLRMIRPTETIAMTMIQRLIQRLWRSVTV